MKFLSILAWGIFTISLLRAQEGAAASEQAVEDVPAAEAEAPMEEVSAAPVEAEAAPAEEAPAEVTEAPAAPEETPPAPDAAEPPPADSAQAEAPPAGEEGAYTVQKGDTLWDLADRFLKNPYQWNSIWEANKDSIRNPNLIYPDQQVRIPGADGSEVAAAEAAPAEAVAPAEEAPAEEAAVEATVEPAAEEAAEAPAEPASEAAEAAPAAEEAPASEVAEAPDEEEAPAEVEAPAPVRKKISRRGAPVDLGNDSFIADDNWEVDGYIVRDSSQKIMISQDDVVYLNVGADDGAKPRMRGSIYRRGGMVRDPQTREDLGYVVRRVGTFQLTDQVGNRTATAVVVTSNEPIRLGDFVKLD